MKIRVGKNIYVSLVIKTSEGEPEDLSVARDLQVVVENKFTQEQYVPKTRPPMGMLSCLRFLEVLFK